MAADINVVARSTRPFFLAVWICLASCSKPKDPELVAVREQIAELQATQAALERRLADTETVLAALKTAAAPTPAPASAASAQADVQTPEARRATRLLVLADAFEVGLPHVGGDLHIDLSEVLDDYGAVKDPAGLCTLLHDRYIERWQDGAQAQLVRTFGAELGTLVYNRTLCDGPAVPRGVAPPSATELSRAFTERIEGDAPGWARLLDIPLNDLVDDQGHLRDLARSAKRAHDVLEAKPHPWNHAVALFGNQLGTAIHFDRVGR